MKENKYDDNIFFQKYSQVLLVQGLCNLLTLAIR